MAKNNHGANKRKQRKTCHSFDNLLDAISNYDPDFLFLPALLVARKVIGKKVSGDDLEISLERVINELKIGDNSRAVKIIKLAKKIIKTK